MIPVARMSAAAAVCGRDRDAQWFNLYIYSINLFLHHEDDDDDEEDEEEDEEEEEQYLITMSCVPILQ